MHRAFRCAALCAVTMGGGDVAVARAQSPTEREYQIKAAFLYNFTKFFHWPAETPAERTICVLGDDPFGEALSALDGKAAGESTVRTRRISDVGDAIGCGILFISGSEDDGLEPILERLQGRSILTVGDMEQFAGRGGMVALVRARNKIEIVFNIDAMAHCGIEMETRLLRLATVVSGPGPV